MTLLEEAMEGYRREDMARASEDGVVANTGSSFNTELRRNDMRFKSWECMTDEEKVAQVRRETEMKMTDEIKTKLTAEEQEAMHKLISSTEPLGKPHKEVWLVQAFDESDEDRIPLFSRAFTDKHEAEKVREAGLAVNTGAGMWTLERVVLDAAEDAERVIDEMVAIDAGRRDE